jgi:hypothetical protein
VRILVPFLPLGIGHALLGCFGLIICGGVSKKAKFKRRFVTYMGDADSTLLHSCWAQECLLAPRSTQGC